MQDKDNVTVGIDLGTTYCSVAYIDESGQAIIEKNLEGSEVTPSSFFFPTSGEIIIGAEAKEKSIAYPEQTVCDVKRMMNTNRKFYVNDKQYDAVELSAALLKKLIGDYRETRGLPVTSAVITVPAYFGNKERDATMNAAHIAGIEEVELLKEPTAAALAYGFGQRGTGHKKILVFDFGGGTLDVTILDVNDSEFAEVATDGSIKLGGIEFDKQLTNIILEKIARESGMDKSVLESDESLIADLNIKAENIKIRLSSSDLAMDTVTLNIGRKVTFEVSRMEFEVATRDLIEDCMDIVDNVLKKTRLAAEDLDAFVLVGGSSIMPMVENGMRVRFPGARINTFFPMQAVAKGAAIYAARNKEGIKVDTILGKTFGVRIRNAAGENVISNIVFRDSVLPCTGTQRYSPEADGQLKTVVEVYENTAYSTDPTSTVADSTPIGTFELKLPEAVPRDAKVSVKIKVEADGRIAVTAECGRCRENLTLNTSSYMTKEQIDESSKKLKDGGL